jgi:hypothetical protein
VTSDEGNATSVAVIDDSRSRETHEDAESTTPLMSTVTVPPTSTVKESGMDVDASASSTDHPSIQVPMDVDEEIGEESTNIVTVAPPGWLTAQNMDVYLKDCSEAKAWQALVHSLYKFEERNTINGVRHYICFTGFYLFLFL